MPNARRATVHYVPITGPNVIPRVLIFMQPGSRVSQEAWIAMKREILKLEGIEAATWSHDRLLVIRLKEYLKYRKGEVVIEVARAICRVALIEIVGKPELSS